MKRLLSGLLAIALAFAAGAPALASINPTITANYTGFGAPGQGRYIAGTIAFGAADTYVTGGFNITPASLGCSVAVTSLLVNAPAAAFETSISFSSGIATVKLSTQMNGASNVTSGTTTKTVTIPTGLTANDVLNLNTAIYVSLDDAATGGGGSGTWAVTDAVASVKFVSGSTFTLTVIANAPASNGNFVWFVPSLNMELPAATTINSIVVPFTATCL